MPFDAVRNFAYGAVTTAPSPATTGTTMTLDSSTIPTPPFNLTLWPSGQDATPANTEIVRVTAATGASITAMTRAQEGTSAKSIAVGYQWSAAITAKTLTDIHSAVTDRIGGVRSSTYFASDGANHDGPIHDWINAAISKNLPAVLEPGVAEFTTPILPTDTSIHVIGVGAGQPTQKTVTGITPPPYPVSALVFDNPSHDTSVIALDLLGKDSTDATPELQEQGTRMEYIALVEKQGVNAGGTQGAPGNAILCRLAGINRARFIGCVFAFGGINFKHDKFEDPALGGTSDMDASWTHFLYTQFAYGRRGYYGDAFNVVMDACDFENNVRNLWWGKFANNVATSDGLHIRDSVMSGNHRYTTASSTVTSGATAVNVARVDYYSNGDRILNLNTGEVIKVNGAPTRGGDGITGTLPILRAQPKYEGGAATTAAAITTGDLLIVETFGIEVGQGRMKATRLLGESTLGDTIGGVAWTPNGRFSHMFYINNAFAEVTIEDNQALDFWYAINARTARVVNVRNPVSKSTRNCGPNGAAIYAGNVTNFYQNGLGRSVWFDTPLDDGTQPALQVATNCPDYRRDGAWIGPESWGV